MYYPCNTNAKKGFANVFYSCIVVSTEEAKEMKPVKIETSKIVAEVLQRMIEEEIANQKQWLKEDVEQFGKPVPCRETIIKELNEMADDLAEQGIAKYVKA